MFSFNIEGSKSDTVHELDRRFRNPFWPGFLFAWITWNWRVWYLTFFVSESLIGNKITEIQRMYEYFGLHALPGIILNWLIIPIIISGIITFWLPKLTDKFLEQQKKNKEKEDTILRKDLKSEEENVKAMTALIEAEKKKFEAEKKKMESELEKLLVEKEKQMKEEAFNLARKDLENSRGIENKSEQEIWNEEFQVLISKYPPLLNELSKLIYFRKGYVDPDYGYANNDYVKIFEVNDLIEKIEEGKDYFKLTEKGKYFLKKQSLG